MSINTLNYAQKFTENLDKLFTQKSVTSFMADKSLATKFVGAKTVLIPDMELSGLADYDRDAGFSRGAITISDSVYTMQMDRGRSLQIDREDMDEVGICNLAGNILGEFIRTKVVPECDAYVLSKLAGVAINRGNLIEGDIEKPYEAMVSLIEQVREKVGFDEELVAFVSTSVHSALKNSDELSRSITVSQFKSGDVNLNVETIDGVPIIPVVTSRMKTGYSFTPTGGGFVPLSNARTTLIMVMPKRCAHLVQKTEKIRIFAPEQNPDADAYKFDYRIYYDVFVKKSGLDAIWAWITPEITITAQPQDIEVEQGSITESLSVTAGSSADLTYQWYSCNVYGGDEIKIVGATSNTYALPTTLTTGSYYYFCKISAGKLASTKSDVAEVTVEA